MTNDIGKFCRHQTVASKVGIDVEEFVTFSKEVGQACVFLPDLFNLYNDRYCRNI